jgi:signal transduction histidine kinase
MDLDALYRRYQELESYVGWSEEDARRIQAVAPRLMAYLAPLIDDFYAEIERHPEAATVITAGREQIERLKGSLRGWLRELLSGPYDRAYVARRRRVGLRHVEIGLDQVYTNVALSRLRSGLIGATGATWQGDVTGLVATIQSINKLLDLDLAMIEDAYQSEYLARQQRVERLAAIGKVAGGVAHELRNPLNVAKTSVYYVLNARNPSPDKTSEHLRRIEQHIGVADGVVTALSNFARLPIPELRPFSVERCVKQALEANPIPEAIRLELDFPSSLPAALGDIDQVRIVFANLVRNARDAMPDGGQLIIRGSRQADTLEVAVTDTGVGISPDNMARIMEPLYSTKARGLGLGLALARDILEKHGGSLHVTSEPQRGSTFTAKLPAEVRTEDIRS